MKVRGIIFDLNGTLIDINTDEGNEQIYRSISHLLKYYGIRTSRTDVREGYYQIMKDQRRRGGEEFPEFDVVAVWREFVATRAVRSGASIPKNKLAVLPHFLAELYRGISLNRLELYPDVREVLDALRPDYRLATVSDAQSAWAVPEMRMVGLDGYFFPVIVSGDFGYRKPDPRLFATALRRMHLPAEEVVFVGNDMYRDIHGARQAGLRTVFFATGQGQQAMDGVEAHYNIYRFAELRAAIRFFEEQG
ncbi:MAG: HAD family hydrolase [Solidesulfovibrio sp. DCME]|uniref:HAD family hydrolase n=1 Tax=Solidesulfovibrio sp. DCME TaxID=3447380 RepID=UPI003D123DEB